MGVKGMKRKKYGCTVCPARFAYPMHLGVHRARVHEGRQVGGGSKVAPEVPALSLRDLRALAQVRIMSGQELLKVVNKLEVLLQHEKGV